MNRTEAAEYIKERCFTAYPNTDDSLWDKAMVTAIKALEQPERKKGKWIQNMTYPMIGSDAVVAEAYCSECKLYSSQINAYGYVTYDICPRCGAEMVKGETDGHN